MSDTTQDRIRAAASRDTGLPHAPGESPLRSLMREILQGSTLGWGDEIAGALGAGAEALTGGSPKAAYTDIRDSERAAHRATQDQSPAGSAAIDIGSSLIPGTGLAKLSTKLATKVASPVVKKVITSPVTQGTEIGTTVGAGTAQGDLSHQAGQTAMGAATGAVSTAGLVLAAKGMHALARGMGWTDANKDAARMIMDAMKKDGLDPQQVLAQAGQLAQDTGKPVTLADVVGADKAAGATGQLFNTALGKTSGSARASIIHGMADRQAGQKDRVVTDFAKGANATQMEIEPMIDQLIKIRKEASQPLYDQAYKEAGPIQDERLTALFDRPSMQTAFKSLKGYAKETGQPLDTSMVKDVDNIHPSLLTGDSQGNKFEAITPNLRALDIVKRRLWDLEQKAKGVDSSGLPSANLDSIAIGDTRRQLTGLLDELGPDAYKQARNVYSDYSSMKDAAEFGYDIFKKSPAEIRKQLAGYTDAERDAFVSGMHGNLTDLTQKDGQDWAAKLLGDSRKRDQLKAVFGDDRQDQLEIFMKQLQAESMQAKAAKTFTGPQPTETHPTDSIGAVLHATTSGVRPSFYDAAKLRLSSATMPAKTANVLSRFGFAPRRGQGDPVIDALGKPTPPYRGGYAPAGASPLMLMEGEQTPASEDD